LSENLTPTLSKRRGRKKQPRTKPLRAQRFTKKERGESLTPILSKGRGRRKTASHEATKSTKVHKEETRRKPHPDPLQREREKKNSLTRSR